MLFCEQAIFFCGTGWIVLKAGKALGFLVGAIGRLAAKGFPDGETAADSLGCLRRSAFSGAFATLAALPSIAALGCRTLGDTKLASESIASAIEIQRKKSELYLKARLTRLRSESPTFIKRRDGKTVFVPKTAASLRLAAPRFDKRTAGFALPLAADIPQKAKIRTLRMCKAFGS